MIGGLFGKTSDATGTGMPTPAAVPTPEPGAAPSAAAVGETAAAAPGPTQPIGRLGTSTTQASATTSTTPTAPTPQKDGKSTMKLGELINNNPYFGAGAGLMILGAGLAALRRGAKTAAHLGQRRMLITLEIPNRDASYNYFLEWMAHQIALSRSLPESERGIKGVLAGKVNFLPTHELAVQTQTQALANGHIQTDFNLVPGPGTHWFRYRGEWFQVKRLREQKAMDLATGTPWETITLTGLSSSRELFPSLLNEARELAEQHKEGKLITYTAMGFEWKQFGKPKPRRPLSSVVLQDGKAEKIADDLKAFLARNKWYAERGIPYRRGYLLHGPPGSGKTSFIQALAGAVHYNICTLNIAERGMQDDKLNMLLSTVPERSFILLEDIDAAFAKRVVQGADGYQSGVTFSGILNALDGVTSSEQRIIFMTTNHPEKLDPALIRPGRIDVNELIDDADGEQAYRLFIKFYGRNINEIIDEEKGTGGFMNDDELPQEEVERLGRKVKEMVDDARKEGRRVSMASLQGHFIRHGAVDSLEGIPELCTDRPPYGVPTDSS